MDRLDVLMREERLRIRDDTAPPRVSTRNRIERDVLLMSRGSWVQVTHARAKSIARVVRRLGGQATVYKTSEAFSVCKVLEAPWSMAGSSSPGSM